MESRIDDPHTYVHTYIHTCVLRHTSLGDYDDDDDGVYGMYVGMLVCMQGCK